MWVDPVISFPEVNIIKHKTKLEIFFYKKIDKSSISLRVSKQKPLEVETKDDTEDS
jgi:hypothetical protein